MAPPGLFLSNWPLWIRHDVLCQTSDNNGPFRFLCDEELSSSSFLFVQGLRFWNLHSLCPTTALSTIDQPALASTHSRRGCSDSPKVVSLGTQLASWRPQATTNWKNMTSPMFFSGGTTRFGSIIPDNTFSGRESEPSSYQRWLTCIFISIGSLLFGASMRCLHCIKSLHSCTTCWTNLWKGLAS